MVKTIVIDGKEVRMRATASVPRLYRIKFGRDIMKDMQKLKNSAKKIKVGEQEEFEIEDLEMFENVSYIMAKHGDPENVPNDIDEWLEGFETFSIYEALPAILELWNLNTQQASESKKKLDQLTAK